MGVGVIVIVEFTSVPLQPPELGVTVYVTVPVPGPGAVNVWFIDVPEPFVDPDALV